MELCEVCRVNTATIHLTQISNGESLTRRLCKDCANEEGIPMGDQDDEDVTDLEELAQEPILLTCSKCGTTEEQVISSGRVGCSHCYVVFRNAIEERSSYLDVYTRYDGKQYRQGSSKSFQSELDTLRRELGTAIVEERFEIASVLRDRIREIEENEELQWS